MLIKNSNSEKIVTSWKSNSCSIFSDWWDQQFIFTVGELREEQRIVMDEKVGKEWEVYDLLCNKNGTCVYYSWVNGHCYIVISQKRHLLYHATFT